MILNLAHSLAKECYSANLEGAVRCSWLSLRPNFVSAAGSEGLILLLVSAQLTEFR